MEKLPSKNAEKLLLRIRDAEEGKLPLSSLSEADLDRLGILSERSLIVNCDFYFPENDPDSSVYIVGPLSKSVRLSTAGMDYLSELAHERKSAWMRFGRDVLMLLIGAVVTLVATFVFNKLSGSSGDKDPVPVSENSPALTAAPADDDFFPGE